jgi:hypothetical protein
MRWTMIPSRNNDRRSRRDRNRTRWLGTLECLEGRALLATFNWVNPMDGSFSDPNNWVDAQTNAPGVPGAGDDAVLPSGDFTVTVGGSTTVNSLNGGGTLDVTSGTFTVNDSLNAATSSVNNLALAAGASFLVGGTAATLTGAALINGKLDVAAGATLAIAGTSINLNTGATTTGAGTLVINSNLDLNTNIVASGTTILDSGGSVGLSGTGTFEVPAGSTFDWRSGYMVGFGGTTTIDPGATLKIEGSETKSLDNRALNNEGTGTWTGTGNWAIYEAAVFTNSGTFAIENDATMFAAPTYPPGTVVNTGTLTKTSTSGTGTTDINVPFNNNNGGKVIAQSGVLQLDNSGTNSSTFNIPSSAGTLWITGRGYSLDVGTTFTGSGTVHFTTGFLGPAVVNLNTNVTIQNLAVDSGSTDGTGSMTIPGTFSFISGTLGGTGSINLPSTANVTLGGSAGITFDTVTVNDSAPTTLVDSGDLVFADNAIFNNSKTFTIQNDTSGNNGSFGGSGTFNNAGTIVKTSVTSTGLTDINVTTLINSGTIHVVSGQLLLDVVGTNTGTLAADPGTVLDLTNNWDLNAGSKLSGTGTFGLGLGFEGYGTVNINTSLTAPNFTLPGGRLNVGASFTVTGFAFSGGTIEGKGWVNIPAGGTVNINGSGDVTFDTVTINDAGATTFGGTGDLTFANGASLNNSGTFTIQNDTSGNNGNINGTGFFDNTGTLNKTSVSGMGTTSFGIVLNNLAAGVINVNSGNLATNSITNRGTIRLAPQTTLAVSGDFLEPNSGTLSIAIGGAPATNLFGEVTATGTANLNGTLNVTLANGFTPTPGQAFPIATYSALTGNFTTLQLPTMNGAPLFTTNPTATEFDLKAVTVTLPTPPAPTLAPDNDTGVQGDGITALTLPHLLGTSVPGDTVQLLVNGLVKGSSTVTANGAYSVQFASPLTDGTYAVSVRVVGGGLMSTPSAPFWLKIETPAVQSSNFDGLGVSEIGVFTPASAQWSVRNPVTLATRSFTFGATKLNDIPVPGDYDGIGVTEAAIFRPSTGQWIIKNPITNTSRTVSFGATNLFDIPVPGDYDGVGRTELAVFRPSTGQWIIRNPITNTSRTVSFGATKLTDIPAPGDYDGIGQTEFAVFTPSTSQWTILNPITNTKRTVTYGAANLTDIPLQGPIASLIVLGKLKQG